MQSSKAGVLALEASIFHLYPSICLLNLPVSKRLWRHSLKTTALCIFNFYSVLACRWKNTACSQGVSVTSADGFSCLETEERTQWEETTLLWKVKAFPPPVLPFMSVRFCIRKALPSTNLPRAKIYSVCLFLISKVQITFLLVTSSLYYLLL